MLQALLLFCDVYVLHRCSYCSQAPTQIDCISGTNPTVALQNHYNVLNQDVHVSRLTALLIAAVREPQCPNNSWGAVSATALNDVHTFLVSALHQNPNPATLLPPIPVAAQSAIKSVNLDSVVLIGHSLGGQVAVNILAGRALQEYLVFLLSQ